MLLPILQRERNDVCHHLERRRNQDAPGGIEPKRLLNEIKQNNISNVVAGMPIYKAMEIMVADADTQVIEGATDSSKLGKNWKMWGYQRIMSVLTVRL